MRKCDRRKAVSGLIGICLVLAMSLGPHRAVAQSIVQKVAGDASQKDSTAEIAQPEVLIPSGPIDEFDRGVPQSSVKGFFRVTDAGNFERGAEYLDLSNLPRRVTSVGGPELARQLKVVLDRTMWIDLELVSENPEGHTEDGLPASRDSLGRIETPEKTVDILLQRVPREDKVSVWKFSNRTVAEIPHLYEHFGYHPLEEKLSQIFPDIIFLGWQIWQWAAFLIFVGIAYIPALGLTWFVGLLIRRKDTDTSSQVANFFTGPLRVVLWLMLGLVGIEVIGPSATIRTVMRGGTLLIAALAWAAVRFTDLVFNLWLKRLLKRGLAEASASLRPMKIIVQVVIVLLAVVVWLDNIGVNVGALVAGLGIGGIAVALAAQDTLKNVIGSLMILLDKPYQVGQRIVVRGHDGVVEEIGFRSTKVRLLTGHQTSIPNDEMARVDIENIGRRPHIRRLTNITITYDTPLKKVEKAVDIIREILDNHEGMDSAFPPRVYFNEFNPDSLNILVIYWYHPPDYWGFLEFNQKVNKQIMGEFEKEGIRFAFPTTTTYVTQESGGPLQVSLAPDSGLREEAS